MSNTSREVRDIGRFVRARREATDASTYTELPTRRRHVPHLTQSDLAELMDISTVVISLIEQGRYPNLSRAILQRISNALRFTNQQDVYLFGLFEKRPASQHSLEPAPEWVTATIKQMAHPVIVVNPAFDLVDINDKAMALFESSSPQFAPHRNGTDTIFLAPAVREFIPEWLPYAASLVSGMKVSYAMFPTWRNYIDSLTGRLAEKDELFRELWHQADPLVKPTIEKRFVHPRVGELSVRQVLTDIIEVPWLSRIDFSPADDETRRKLERM